MLERVKYPRTFHLPNSPGISSDDKVLPSTVVFHKKEVVITEKLDGENTTMYPDYIHARSIDGRYHPSRDWVKAFHAQIRHQIPIGDRICGENLYAQHSIAYNDLESYFYGFSYWSQQLCLDYDNTIAIFEQLGINSPTVIYRGIYDDSIVESIANSFPNEKEGFVIRITESFHYDDFHNSVAKWVRKNHVTTNDHWMHQLIVPNRLRSNVVDA